MLEPLPQSFVTTREALHALAEHVIASARYRVDGHIGLTPSPGGFGTPVFGDGERVRVEGTELVHERPGTTTRIGITTLGDAAQFLGIPLGAPTNVYKPMTACMPDVPLSIDAAAARALADWYALGATMLGEVRDAYAAHKPSGRTIWPEHFDLAGEIGDEEAGNRANFGASPGDADIAEPYLYVGPWNPERRQGIFARCGFGAAFTYGELMGADDVRSRGVDFYIECAALLIGQP